MGDVVQLDRAEVTLASLLTILHTEYGPNRATKRNMATPYTSFGLPPSTAAYYSQQGPFSTQQIPEGKYTQTVYTAIRDGKYEAVIKMLENEIQNAEARRIGTGGTPAGSRAAWSLMGFAMYRMQDCVGDAEW